MPRKAKGKEKDGGKRYSGERQSVQLPSSLQGNKVTLSLIKKKVSLVYMGGLQLVAAVRALRERGLSLSVCLFPHSNSDIDPRDTDAVFSLLHTALPNFLRECFSLAAAVREYMGVVVLSSLVDERSIEGCWDELKLLIAIQRWLLDTVTIVLTHFLAASDVLVGGVLSLEEITQTVGDIIPSPPTLGEK